MKTLQDRMNGIKQYFRGIEMYNEAIMVKVTFPKNWKVYPSEDGKIKVTPSDSDKSLSYYYADSNESTYDDIFDLIEQTIKANKDIVLKLGLLKEKVEELKELFQSSTYDELVNLKFVIDAPKKKRYTKKMAQKKEEEPNNTEKIEDSNE